MIARVLSSLVLAAGALAAPGSNAPPSPIEVRPGSIVRWIGSEALDCRLGDRHLEPLSGVCYFPIDLLATGELEVERRTAAGRERRRLRIGAYPYPTETITGVEDKYVAPSAAELARIRREAERVARLWSLSTPRRFSLPLTAPLTDLPESGRFGSRRIFNGEPRSPHGGSDYRQPAGASVFAPADGRVALAEEHFFAGKSIYLDHGDGLISMCFHLSAILVAPGESVKQGQLIGRVGATGRVTGPHLHFGLRWHGARIDPGQLLGPLDAVPAIGGS